MKKQIPDFKSLFAVDGTTIECRFRVSQDAFCQKRFKSQQRDCIWNIANFTRHINEEHLTKGSFEALSDSITSLLDKTNKRQTSEKFQEAGEGK
jgi:hypothetical protein